MTNTNDDARELGPPWTILKILRWTTGYLAEKQSDSPRLDAEVLLAHALNLERVQLYAQFDRPLLAEELTTVRALVKRRAAKEPIAYIVGSRGFWTIELKTDARALIPRPDTEVLVEAALELLAIDSEASVVDVGTGTGAIALALVTERPKLRMAATDLRADTLALAAENAELLGLTSRVHFFEGDLLEALDPSWAPLDMIVSNPPYIAVDQKPHLMGDVRDFEPELALFAGPEGLDVIRPLVAQAFAHLKPGGAFLCEIGYDQGSSVRALFEQAGFGQVLVRPDYARCDRVVIGKKPLQP
ncbi:MAG: peptide chain release factor N(5)-glutamine methyltransferase [Bradymonadaceae bacterium]|nr:peptide chain release factor N(5)-glutamine methyltransferase [Lujinxingiaceae bacterium]